MEKRSVNEWKHVGIFGPLSHERTHLVKQTIEEMKEEQKGRVLIFDPHAHYETTENKTMKTLTNSMFYIPEGVPHLVWAEVITEILAEAFRWGNRASILLNKTILDLFALIKKEGKEYEKVRFLTHISQMLTHEFERRQTESAGRLFFAEQEAHDILKQSLHTLNNWLSPSEEVDSTNRKSDNHSEDGPIVYDLFGSNTMQRLLATKMVLAREFYARKYNKKLQNEPLFVALEQAHLLFSGELTQENVHVNESFTHQLLREAKHHGMHFVFITESEEDLPTIVLRSILNKHVLFESNEVNEHAKL